MGFGKKFKRQEVAEPLEEEVEELEVPTPQPIRRVSPPPFKQEEASFESDWEVKEIPTQTQPMIYNKRTKKYLGLYEAIAEILNRSEE